MYAAAGVNDHLLAGFKAFEDLRFGSARATHFEQTQLRPSGFDHEGGPLLTLSEQSARWNLKGVLGFPDDNPGFDPEVVTHVSSRIRWSQEVDDDIDALFFDAQSRYLGEGGWFDEPDPADERLVTAPLIEFDLGSWGNHGAVSRKHFHDDFQVCRVAYFQQGRACGYNAGTLFENLEDSLGDRRFDFLRHARGVGIATTGGTKHRQLGLRLAQGAFGARLFLGGGGFPHLSGLQFLNGNGLIGV